MSKFNRLAFLFLILCIITIFITFLALNFFPIVQLNNTIELNLTFDSVEKSLAQTYHLITKEYRDGWIIHDETIVNIDALLNLTAGESITVRILSEKNTEYDSIEVVEMCSNGIDIVAFEKFKNFSKNNRKMILTVCITFIVIFAAASAICFCLKAYRLKSK